MIAIIGAMEEEVQAVLNEVKEYLHIQTSPFNLYQFKMNNETVLVCQSGIGKVNAAITTSYLILKYPIRLIINVGSAGGLKQNQAIQDVVVASECIYHDLIFDFAHPETSILRATYPVSTKYQTLIDSVLSDLNIPHWQGTILSGDQFISDRLQLKDLMIRFPDAIGVEMESCAISHVCQKLNVDVIILRSISDLAHQTNNEIDFETYLPKAAKQSALVCLKVIESLRNE